MNTVTASQIVHLYVRWQIQRAVINIGLELSGSQQMTLIFLDFAAVIERLQYTPSCIWQRP